MDSMAIQSTLRGLSGIGQLGQGGLSGVGQIGQSGQGQDGLSGTSQIGQIGQGGLSEINQIGQGGLTGGVPSVEAPSSFETPSAPSGSGMTNGPSFQETLKAFLSDVNDQVTSADQGMADLATGKTADIHNVLINMRKADFQVKLLVETRNKVLDAYKDVMSISA